jgi:hypothetical protein
MVDLVTGSPGRDAPFKAYRINRFVRNGKPVRRGICVRSAAYRVVYRRLTAAHRKNHSAGKRESCRRKKCNPSLGIHKKLLLWKNLNAISVSGKNKDTIPYDFKFL